MQSRPENSTSAPDRSLWYEITDTTVLSEKTQVEEFIRSFHDDAKSRWGLSWLLSGRARPIRYLVLYRDDAVCSFFLVPPERERGFIDRYTYEFDEASLVRRDTPDDLGIAYRLRETALSTPDAIPVSHTSRTGSIHRSLSRLGDGAMFCIDFIPASDRWRSERLVRALLWSRSAWKRTLIRSGWYDILRIFALPFRLLFRFFVFLFNPFPARTQTPAGTIPDSVAWKIAEPGFSVAIAVGLPAEHADDSSIDSVVSRLTSSADENRIRGTRIRTTTLDAPLSKTGILTAPEIASFIALSEIPVPKKEQASKSESKKQNASSFVLPAIAEHDTPVGVREWAEEPFGVSPEDRTRHIYIIGKTGMGKTTLLQNMILDDIEKWRGVAFIDPHGDPSLSLLDLIPSRRTNDIVVFDPSDTEHPVALNILEAVDPRHRSVTASSVLSVFKRIYGDSWGPRLEYILRNALLTLLSVRDATLASVVHMLTNDGYRRKIVGDIDDPVLSNFWKYEFEKMDRRQMTEAVAPILNKVGQFLGNPILRNVLLQPKSAFSLRWIMDQRKILVIRLPKGTIGEDVTAFLGALLITRLQIEAMSRANIAESERVPFALYVDEFQNFATESFESILSEARKFGLSLTLANQYVAQMSESVQRAVFWNVGSLFAFQVGAFDEQTLASVMSLSRQRADELQTLPRYHIYARLSVDGTPTPPFRAQTLPPAVSRTEIDPTRRDAVIRVSRERYSKSRTFVEAKIAWQLRAVEEMRRYEK